MDKSKQAKVRCKKKKVQNAKSNNLQARPQEGKVININESKKLLHEIENSQITYEEALKRKENIRRDINKLVKAHEYQHKLD